MFSRMNNDKSNPFRPALQYLLSGVRPEGKDNTRNTSSGSSLDSERVRMNWKTPSQTSSELHPGSIPLINISRTSSPYPRSGSNHTSENEDDDFDTAAASRPFLLENRQRNGWKGIFLDGGFGRWLFTTAIGWQFYVGFMVLWVGACGIGLICMNRIILLSTLISAAPIIKEPR